MRLFWRGGQVYHDWSLLIVKECSVLAVIQHHRGVAAYAHYKAHRLLYLVVSMKTTQEVLLVQSSVSIMICFLYFLACLRAIRVVLVQLSQSTFPANFHTTWSHDSELYWFSVYLYYTSHIADHHDSTFGDNHRMFDQSRVSDSYRYCLSTSTVI